MGASIAGAGLLFERDAELARLDGMVTEAHQGRGGFVVVEGPPGIGKTRLLDAARGTAEPGGMEVLSARGSDLEHDLPFGVVRQLFERRLRREQPARRHALLAGPAELAASALFNVDEWSAESASGDRSYAVLHALYWLTSNLAERAPLLLCVDDAHWSDPASLRFLHYMARRIGDLPVLLAVTLRTADPEAQDELVARLRSEPHATVLTLEPLSPAAVADVVRAGLAADAAAEFCDACHTATAGNPFLVRELIGALRVDGVQPNVDAAERVSQLVPEAVSRHVLARLARLSADAAALARAVALLGKDVELVPAGRLAGLDRDAAVAAVDALAEAELLRPGLPLEFAHPLVREAVYAEMAPGQRASLHAEAARMLSETGARPDLVASQLLVAAQVREAWAVEALRGAAGGALARGSPESAASCLRRALAEPLDPAARADIVLELAGAEARVRGPAATERLADALRLEREPRQRASIAELLARRLAFDARPTEAVAVCRQALEELGGTDAEARARLQSELLRNALIEPAMAGAAGELLERARRIERADSFGAKALLALGAFGDARAGAPAADVTARAQRALAGGELMTRDNGGPAFILAVLVLAAADSELALPTLEAGLRLARETGNLLAIAAAKIFGCHARMCRGQLLDAIADGYEALDAVATYEVGIGPPYACAYLADALIERGELDGAQRTLDLAGDLQAIPDNADWHWFLDSRARLRLARGDRRQALEETLECGRRFEAVGGRNPAFMAWRSRAAWCLTLLGEAPARARDLADEELELARAFGAPRAIGEALRIGGLVRGARAGLPLLREAVDVLEPSLARLALAHALCDLGVALHHLNEREAARDTLRRAMDQARACGATPLRERAHAQLVAAGARPRRLTTEGIDALTPAERRVAAVAAEGYSNREIAAALFLSLKTVEMHLTRVYRKLELRHRSQLVAALAAEESA